MQPNVTVPIGAATEVIAGEGMIVTAGGIDCHPLHLSATDRGGARQRRHHHDRWRHRAGSGTSATTVTPGIFHMREMLRAADAFR